jgi:peptidoglycan/LPS O-acetylase OafA/YrhL
MKWKYSLDFLRAMAILLVLFYHYPLPSTDLFWSGLYIHIQNGFKSGVDLFFVLSGFLISSHWFLQLKNREKLSVMLKNFYVKRSFRILPLYYLILLLEALRATFLKKMDYNLWSYLSLTQNIFGKTIFIVSWSLCVEEHFYLFFPAISYFFYSWGKKRIFVLFTASLFFLSIMLRYLYFDYLFSHPQAWLDQNTLFILDGLSVGVLTGYLFVFKGSWIPIFTRYLRSIEIAGGILLAFSFYISGSNFNFVKIIFLPSFFSMGYGLLVLSANLPESIFNKFKHNFITLTSRISYPLYLTHYMAWMGLEILLRYFHLSLKGAMGFIVYFTVAYALAWTLHEVIEKKFLNLRKIFLTT